MQGYINKSFRKVKKKNIARTKLKVGVVKVRNKHCSSII